MFGAAFILGLALHFVVPLRLAAHIVAPLRILVGVALVFRKNNIFCVVLASKIIRIGRG